MWFSASTLRRHATGSNGRDCGLVQCVIELALCAMTGRSSSREFVVLGVIIVVHFLVHVDSPQLAVLTSLEIL